MMRLMQQLRMLTVLALVGLAVPVAAQDGPARGMLYCLISAKDQPLPGSPNLAILFSKRFEEMAPSDTVKHDVLATVDADGLMGGSKLSSVLVRSDGRISIFTEFLKNKESWLLVAQQGKMTPLFDAILGFNGKSMFRGFCDRVQMKNADAEFASHPPKRSTEK